MHSPSNIGNAGAVRHKSAFLWKGDNESHLMLGACFLSVVCHIIFLLFSSGLNPIYSAGGRRRCEDIIVIAPMAPRHLTEHYTRPTSMHCIISERILFTAMAQK